MEIVSWAQALFRSTPAPWDKSGVIQKTKKMYSTEPALRVDETSASQKYTHELSPLKNILLKLSTG